MSINILDCTLRDGGYINDWDFTDHITTEIIQYLETANIDIIECGYLNNKKGKDGNSTLFDSTKSLDRIIEKSKSGAKKVAMINLGDYDIQKLDPKSKTYIDGIRLAFHKKDISAALDTAVQIISLGYELYFQPMITKSYSDTEFLDMIKRVNLLDIHAFYIVDSFGSMHLEEFDKYLRLSRETLNADVAIGYHSHNNMQLAYSNAIKMCSSNSTRDIIIDSSIYGIGRGAGNLNTELIVDYLNNNFAANYNTLPLLEAIDQYLEVLMYKNPWGFSLAQYLSASLDCHPSYTTYLIDKNTKHIVSVKEILEKIPLSSRATFDRTLIETLYMESLWKIKTKIKGSIPIKGKKILLIASGKTTDDYRELINNKSLDESYLCIALNHIPAAKCDYYFFSNQKRFDTFCDKLPSDKIIISSNIESSKDVKIVLDFKKYAFVQDTFIANVATVLLNYLIEHSLLDVELAGLSGYSIGENENYSYTETNIIASSHELKMQNNILDKAFRYLGSKINLIFITPSIFANDANITILGVIPARFKSSRFEGKPLALINGVEMIKRTYLQAKMSNRLDELVVATDDYKIQEYCNNENIPVVMTSAQCLTGTDRIAEVATMKNFDLYVNIQGDEPIIDPVSIDEVVDEFKKYGNQYVAYNLYKTIETPSEVSSDTIIKVIVDQKDNLLYMSRHAIPYNKSKNTVNFKKQVCVYGFTKKALELFSGKDKTLNEQHEDIEILRFLDMGYRVKMKETKVSSIAVDVPDDILKVETYLKKNGLA